MSLQAPGVMKPSPSFAVEFFLKAADYPRLFNQYGEPNTVQLKADWLDRKFYMEQVSPGDWAVTLLLKPGPYGYNFIINGSSVIDAKNPEKPRRDKSMLVVPSSSSSFSIIELKSSSVTSGFAAEYARKMRNCGLLNIDKDRSNPDRPVLWVLIGKRLTHNQTKLPLEYEWPKHTEDYGEGESLHQIWHVQVQFCPDESVEDDSDKVLRALNASTLDVPMTASMRKSMTFFLNKKYFASHKGYLTVSFTGAKFDGELEKKVLAVIMSDWEAAAEIEQLLPSKWGDFQVCTARDRWIELLADDPYHENLCVGTVGGNAGMTVGVILRKKPDDGERYMIQCAHGYKNEGEKYAFYPTPCELKSARLMTKTIIKAKTDAETKAGLTEREKERIENLNARVGLLEKAISELNHDNTALQNPAKVPFVQIGEVIQKNPEIDAALIKLHLSNKKGMERKFNKPPNLLRNSDESKSIKGLPESLTGLSSLNDDRLIQTYQKGEKSLAKLGCTTGFTQLHATASDVLKDGRKVVSVIPFNGSIFFPSGKIIDRGDSSSPVFDPETGVVVGMVSAKWETHKEGYLINWSRIQAWLNQFGNFELA